MKKVVIFGTGKFAELVHFYLTHDSDYEIVAFTENLDFDNHTKFLNKPVIPFEKIKEEYPPQEFSMFIAVVYTQVNKIREKFFNEAKSKGYDLISYVNSKTIHWGELDLGENCFIFENVVIQPFVKIGNNVIIWSGNHIGHHSNVGNHCFITSHVVISGNVSVGERCFLGVNSTIRDGINIGSDCVIGAGSVILKNTKEKEVYTSNGTKLLPISSDEIHSI
jgi:sugar O-acyltransferase (sialic acid O-acetyltransferase NeuD family)